jgi:hypothetical protein
MWTILQNIYNAEDVLKVFKPRYAHNSRQQHLSSGDLYGLGPQSPRAALPTINTEASPNPNDLNSNVTIGRNSVGIAALDTRCLSYKNISNLDRLYIQITQYFGWTWNVL